MDAYLGESSFHRIKMFVSYVIQTSTIKKQMVVSNSIDIWAMVHLESYSPEEDDKSSNWLYFQCGCTKATINIAKKKEMNSSGT